MTSTSSSGASQTLFVPTPTRASVQSRQGRSPVPRSPTPGGVPRVSRGSSRRARRFGRGRGMTLLAAAALLGGGALAAGSGILRLPTVVPPAPTVVPTPTPRVQGLMPCNADRTISIHQAGRRDASGLGHLARLLAPVALDLDAGAAPGAVGFGKPEWRPQRPRARHARDPPEQPRTGRCRRQSARSGTAR